MKTGRANIYTLDTNTRWLLASRAARSIGQGTLVVAFPLYLHALRAPAWLIGSIIGAGITFAVAVTLLVGPLSDRLGRRWFLVGYECLLTSAAGAALTSPALAVLIPAAVIGGFGRGQNGGAGPFVPVEYAWLAGLVPSRERGAVFSLNTALGSFGMAAGALLATLPALLQHWLPGAAAYRPLFGLVIVGSLTSATCLLMARDTPQRALSYDRERASEEDERHLRQQENGLMARLAGINALNGLAIGLVGPLIAYWFAVRFSVGPAKVAPVMAAGFLLAAFSSLGAGWATRRLGVVRSVVVLRGAGLVTLALLPLAPTFHVAAALHVLRSALNRGTIGARQALNVSLVRPHRRGLAVSLSSVAMQVPRAAGPALAGLMFTNGWWTLPFFVATGLQGAYLHLYHRFFRNHDPGTRR